MPKNKPLPSPYPCQSLSGLQLFTTDAGVEYAMGFRNVSHSLSPVLGIYDIRVYTFDVFSNRHSAQDDRVAATIHEAVGDFFTDSNRVLTWICDTSDGRQAQRQRLFTAWTRNMADLKLARVEAGEGFLGGILMRQDFQHWDVLRDELFDPVRGIGTKFE